MGGLHERLRHLTGRPFVAVLPMFAAGVLVPSSLAGLLLLGFGLYFGRKFLPLGVALFCAAFLRTIVASHSPEPLPNKGMALVGSVASTPYLTLRSQRVLLNLPDRTILVYAPAEKLIGAGDVLRVSGRLTHVTNPYWLRRQINQSINVMWSGGLETLAPGNGAAALGSAWRDDMWQRLRRNLPVREAALAMGVVAGQQGLVEDGIQSDMQRAGTLHLLATSGFNVLLLAGVLMAVLSHLPIPRGYQLAIAGVLLLAYADAVGGRPPVMRATLMAVLYIGAFLYYRSPDALSIAAFSAIVWLLIEPWSIFDAGFQLSYACVFALILYGPLVMRGVAKVGGNLSKAGALAIRGLLASLGVSLIAQLASFPLTSAHFGVGSLVAPISNLLTAPAVPLIYIGACLAQVLDFVSPTLSKGWDVLVTGPFCAWIEWVGRSAANLPFAAINVRMPDWLAFACFALMLAFSPPNRRREPLDGLELQTAAA